MNNFSKPPKNINSFIEEADKISTKKVRSVSIRFPENVYLDIKKITSLTSFSFNAICVEMLRVEAKKKVKELESEYG